PVKNTRNVADSLSRDLRGRLCRKALWSPCLWEIGRQGRPKICVPSDHHYHGIRDDHHRPPSILPSYRSSSTRNSSFHSHATRACPRWGLWRRSNIRRRTCAGRETWVLDYLYQDNRYYRLISLNDCLSC